MFRADLTKIALLPVSLAQSHTRFSTESLLLLVVNLKAPRERRLCLRGGSGTA
jgi:hypothetical protein